MQRPYARRYLAPNNMREAFHGDFEYVVTKKAQPRICFGSAISREVLPTGGPAMSPFMRRHGAEIRAELGPGSHDVPNREAFYDLTHRHYSTLGLGAKAPRWMVKREPQPPLKLDKVKKRFKQNCAPFNQTSQRRPMFTPLATPSPCDYNPQYKKREIKFAYSFSGKKQLKCAVNIKCVPYNLDACGICDCSCSAQGDYWHFENRVFLCRKHYARLFTHCLAKFQCCKLKDFKPIRDCFFAHAHNSCKAAMKIMTQEDIVKKLRKEAYLDLYYPLRRACS